MGLVPSGDGNPFSKLDARAILGTFKASGSRDPDVLHALRQKLLAQPKHLKLLSYMLIGGGALFTVTFILAIFGIPCLLFGLWMWRFSAKNIAAVEQGYADYTATLAA